jgi:hypothetical protein
MAPVMGSSQELRLQLHHHPTQVSTQRSSLPPAPTPSGVMNKNRTTALHELPPWAQLHHHPTW